jgi:hypothetical protein
MIAYGVLHSHCKSYAVVSDEFKHSTLMEVGYLHKDGVILCLRRWKEYEGARCFVFNIPKRRNN